ncbi:lipopolysaccharide biosynthesis protein [Vagococcus salmoninarum]|uniref:lipopolysaccharide biosynthesis protein n=1 Tax=Vagococcus salmoninarum TaxID=2739 RepID=UPI001882D07B|nr:hypothetical protein [Vagococcus salmoninarum]MBE9387815.1 hypothetical protein [Vagococcus salmoninarum]
MKKFLNDVSYTLLSNFTILFVNLLLVLFIPKLLTIEEYGFWQLYLFYGSYVTLFTLGWSDGLYLRYGGFKENDLDKELLSSQFKMIVLLQLLVTSVMLYSSTFVNDDNLRFIIFSLGISSFCINVSYFFTHLLQAIGLFKRYALNSIVTRMLTLLSISILLIKSEISFVSLVKANLIVAISSLVYTFFQTRKYFLNTDVIHAGINWKEAIYNIKSGSVLLFANTINMLVVGVARKGIEINYGIETFAKVSLMLSFLTFLITFINSFSMVFYPMLRRTSVDYLPTLFVRLKKIIMPFLLVYLCCFYLVPPFIKLWLPKYIDSIEYMKILYIIGLIELKVNFINNTFLKVLRKEKIMLFLNLFSIVLCLFLVITLSILKKDVTYMIFTIVIVLYFRMLLSDIYLIKVLKLTNYWQIFVDVIIIAIFYSLLFLVDNGMLIMCVGTVVYVVYNWKTHIDLVKLTISSFD